jgi:hypothetical protein
MIKLRDGLKFLVSFFLMFAVILMQLSFFSSLKVLNGDFYKSTLSKNDYFHLVRKDIDFGFKNLSMITSIPEETFTSSVSDAAIIDLANRNIDITESYMKYDTNYIDNKIDTVPINNNLQKYVEKNNIKIDADLKNQLLTVSQDAGNIINNHTILFNINAVDKYPQFQSFRKAIYLLYSTKIISIFAILLMVTLLALLNKRRPRRVFLWIGSSLIPAAIITLVPSILALYYRIPNRFSIDSAYLNLALRDISLGYIKYFIVTGIIVLLIGIACMCTYTYLSAKVHKAYGKLDKQ